MLEILQVLAKMDPAAAFFGAVVSLSIGGVLVTPIIAHVRRQNRRLEIERDRQQSDATVEIARINVSRANGLVEHHRGD